MPTRNRAHRLSALIALGDNPRLLLRRPRAAMTGPRKHFQPPHRVRFRLRQKLSVRHGSNRARLKPSDNHRLPARVEGGVKRPLTEYRTVPAMDLGPREC
jgi:hypothetical protein